jgi:hypothetical protein
MMRARINLDLQVTLDLFLFLVPDRKAKSVVAVIVPDTGRYREGMHRFIHVRVVSAILVPVDIEVSSKAV